MFMALRHLLSIALLPFVVAVVVPIWLARRDGIRFAPAATLPEAVVQGAGLMVIAVGLVLFVSSLQRFVVDGKGTLAPWDPPRRLVLRGPYRFVRNPMISGVVFVLVGEGMMMFSRPHFVWALTFFAINCVYIPLIEEPMLEARFGDSYAEYSRHVPRLVPRLRPWRWPTE